MRQMRTLRDGHVLLYRLLPSMRVYVEQALPQAYPHATLLARFGTAYASLARVIYDELNRSASLIHIAQQAREDLARVSPMWTVKRAGITSCIGVGSWSVWAIGSRRYT